MTACRWRCFYAEVRRQCGISAFMTGWMGFAGVGAGHFALPPGQLGAGKAGVFDLIHHVIDLAAERIKRGNGSATLACGRNKKA
jgi:hypothetical protein